MSCFNTQPPEGGWTRTRPQPLSWVRFNTQPPEGGWLAADYIRQDITVSTHSRPKAAGAFRTVLGTEQQVSTHSRPKAAGLLVSEPRVSGRVSTHSRPKAAGRGIDVYYYDAIVSTHSRPKAAGKIPTALYIPPIGFNTQPPEGGWTVLDCYELSEEQFQHTAARRRLGLCARQIGRRGTFQHTAARRRLVDGAMLKVSVGDVSTHSRPKAAGFPRLRDTASNLGFNTQPPEGGWSICLTWLSVSGCFNTQPPEGGWTLRMMCV